MRRQLSRASLVFVVFTLLVGIGYPSSSRASRRSASTAEADGSLVEQRRAGRRLEPDRPAFTAPKWFQPRPSAAGDGYDALASCGSNLGPTNPELARGRWSSGSPRTARRTGSPRRAGAGGCRHRSGSGLDPHISVANARYPGAARRRGARHLAGEVARSSSTTTPTDASLGFLGEPGVNVLELNLALDASRD